MEEKLAASAKVQPIPYITPADKKRASEASSTQVRDIGSTNINVYAGGATSTKRRSKNKSVNIVRQPDKQGIERYIDPDYSQKLQEIESRIQEIMQERQEKGAPALGYMTVGALTDEPADFSEA